MSELLLTRRWVARMVILAVVVTACAWLGWWQWDRARVEIVRSPPAGVVALAEIHEPGQPVNQDQIGRRVALTGTFDAEREVLVVDRQDAGRSGVWVVTAFLPADAAGAVIPVVRGWLPTGELAPPPPRGDQDLVAWLEPTESDALRERGRDPLPDGQVEVVSSAQLLSLWQPPLFQGFVIQQQPAPEAPLVEVAPPSLTVDGVVDWQNAAYGIQWWLFGLFAIFWFFRMARVEREDLSKVPGARDETVLDTMDASRDSQSTRTDE
ncbi:MAG: SURF1 family protein [Actinomycetes bacterium]